MIESLEDPTRICINHFQSKSRFVFRWAEYRRLTDFRERTDAADVEHSSRDLSVLGAVLEADVAGLLLVARVLPLVGRRRVGELLLDVASETKTRVANVGSQLQHERRLAAGDDLLHLDTLQSA